MIALDTSAIVAITMREPEAMMFDLTIVERRAIIGAPTLVEARMVLSGLMPTFAQAFLDGLIAKDSVRPVDFTPEMYHAASDAFIRYGKGRGHPAKLNFGDCLSYAVAKVHGIPLLFKGSDFVHTDLVSACIPAP